MVTFQRCGYMGQLGNELFQYATLMSLALKRGYEYGLPLTANTKSQDRFARLALQDGFEGITAKDSSHIPTRVNVISKVQKVWSEPPNTQWTFNPNVLELPDGTDLQGFFQTEKYFADIRPQLLKEFIPKKIHSEKAGNWLANIPSPRVFVHVRRGDSFGNGSLTKIGDDVAYFYKAACHFNGPRFDGDFSNFVVLSDDMQWCKENLRFSSNINWSPFSDKFVDLEVMRQCEGGIISNSSFSWWGAWLGEDSRKIVAPANWSSNNVPCPDVMPERWVKV